MLGCMDLEALDSDVLIGLTTIKCYPEKKELSSTHGDAKRLKKSN
jgi:hypothetical protein